jgi:hypothetical protein
VNALKNPSHGRYEGGLKVNEHRERLRELYSQASKDYTPATLMKLIDEKLL